MGRGLIIVLAMVLGLAASAQAQTSAPASRFANWTSAIVAADWRDGADRPIQAFDNARRDLVRGFLAAGFPRSNMVDYSLRPDAPQPVSASAVLEGINAAAARGTSGCLLYFTSHGAPTAMVFGEAPRMTPDMMANIVRAACGTRPTVVIVSACYSGIFVNALAAPNRMVLTAASRERTSFGCGADETYPWFDGCIIETLPTATDFLALAAGTRACVTRKETERGVSPASEPQMFVGAEMQLRLPTLRFSRTP
ncbi:MAG: C13 family peptidase [Brevundimonas sp.]|uniref:C13 family peptidase n=1 Tax=Brevundimonas sp. TaxID=1871086 RepID=UPI00271876EF|nr:C13 family peptidase [Brevundimonas sp.]MDO9076243.1 C13 family peptidase [Brevundimonas sp.]MDP3079861.1 C13 family peptidase [Brevundimonas sp.]MDZ4061041.1 C13 family peptidase [Brevundimonas sp.]